MLPISLVVLIAISLFLNFVFKDGRSALFTQLFPSYTYLIENGKSTLFYGLPFRIYELAIGSLLVFIPNRLHINALIAGVLFSIGLAMIAYAAICFTDQHIFPYKWGLVPCVGTALVIYYGQSTKLSEILANRAMIFVGVISYALYLTHWPIIAYSHYLSVDFSLLNQALILLASLATALLLHRLVEKPFRSSKTPKMNCVTRYAFLCGFMLLVGLASHSYFHGGRGWRIEGHPYIEIMADASEYHRTYYGGAGYPYFGTIYGNLPADIVLIGDSHARHYADGLMKVIGEKHGVSVFIAAGTSCFHLPNFSRSTPGHDWDQLSTSSLSKALDFISKDTKLVIVSHAWVTQLIVAKFIDSNVRPVFDDLVNGIIQLSSACPKT